MPMVAATLVAASSTGMPAAMSAPKAISISTRVTGRLMPSAAERSSATCSPIASSSDTSPAWRISSSGCAAPTRAVTSCSGPTVFLVPGQLGGDQQRGPVRAPLRLGHLVDALDLAEAGHQRGGGVLGLGGRRAVPRPGR